MGQNAKKLIMIMLTVLAACISYKLAVMPHAAHTLAGMAPEHPIPPPDCKEKFPGALTVAIDDEKFYVSMVLDRGFKKWPGGKLQGKKAMVIAALDDSRTCYVV